jgi:hypothetical protein
MVAENFEKTLRAFARRTPFQPFMVELISGAHIQVDHPEALVFRGGVAVYLSSEGVPTIFDHHSVSRVSGATDQTAKT